MRVTLINPPALFAQRAEITPSQCLGLRSLSSMLKQHGHTVVVVDALLEGINNVKRYANGLIAGLEYAHIAAKVPSDSDMIAVGVPFSQLAPIAHDLIALLRGRFPNAMIVMGGIYPSTQPRLALTSQADFVVIGEGELAIRDLASGRDPDTIPGVYSRTRPTEQAVFVNAMMAPNLDELPGVDYDLPRLSDYFNISPRGRRGKTASILTSRGCPYACEFCSIHPVYGHHWRARSAANVLEEIELLRDRFGIRHLEFEDDNLTLRNDRAAAIFEGILQMNERGAGLEWSTPNGIRIDSLNEDLIALMQRSGCTSLVLALEHGDPEMLNRMNKKLNLETSYRTIEWSVKHGIPRIDVFVIVGYPGETRERFERSMLYLKRLQGLSDRLSIKPNIAQPYPGTKLLQQCRAEGYIESESFDNFLVRRDLLSTTMDVSITSPDFDAREVRRRFTLLKNSFGPKWKRTIKRMLPEPLLDLMKNLRRIGYRPTSFPLRH
jgi:anaerobic magnesium-protoporphyrin IX monomethyl ester cyclase